MTLSSFESLSDAELRAFGEKLGLDFPSELDRRFMIEELLEAMEEESEERSRSGEAALLIEERKFACQEHPGISADCPPSLPERYGDTMIRAIPRDPSWAFAFWDIADAERAAIRNDDGDSALFLRVTEISGGEEGRKAFFDIPISLDDARWYINLPRPKARYRIELCFRSSASIRDDGASGTARIRILARSGEVAVPGQVLEESLSEIDPATAELLVLSGLSSLNIEPLEDESPQRILKRQPVDEQE